MMVALHGSPVVGVYGLLLAPVWLAVVIVHILPRPEAARSDHPPIGHSPVRRVAVLLVVVILLVAAVAVQLLLLLMVQPAMGRQRAVPALLGFELLLIKNVNNLSLKCNKEFISPCT